MVEREQPVLRKESLRGEGGVEGGTRVAFGENQKIAVREGGVGRVDPHFPVIEKSEHFDHGHGAADMADAEMADFLDGEPANFARAVLERLQFLCIHDILHNYFHKVSN